MKHDVYLCVDRQLASYQLQLSIMSDGAGYRIAGPKFDGRSESLIKHKLSRKDADEIITHLRKIK